MSKLGLVLFLVMLGGCADPATWSIEQEVADAALLSVLSTDYGIYVVGADDGEGPIVLRGVGERWERLWTGYRGDLWWVAQDTGTDADGAILMGGAGGRLLRYDPDDASFELYPTPRAVTVFGIWAAPDGSAYAVGGDVAGENGRGEIWVRRGTEWVRDERVPAEWIDEVVLFKVWGTGPNDVWVVGEHGTVLHFDGTAWGQIATPLSTRLLTVHGDPAGGPVVVGGTGNGIVLEMMDDGSFADRMPPFMPGANGVFVDGSGKAWVVGNQGAVLSREHGGQWVVDETSPTRLDLHAVTVDAEGTIWAVGGALLSPSFDQGVVIRLGH